MLIIENPENENQIGETERNSKFAKRFSFTISDSQGMVIIGRPWPTSCSATQEHHS